MFKSHSKAKQNQNQNYRKVVFSKPVYSKANFCLT